METGILRRRSSQKSRRRGQVLSAAVNAVSDLACVFFVEPEGSPAGVGGCPWQASLLCWLRPVRYALREEGPGRRQEQEQREEPREAPAEEGD